MKDVVIVGALRTPIGCFQGTLSRHSAVELGSVVVKALVERSGVDPQSIDEVILGGTDGGHRPESCAPVGNPRRAAQYRFCHYH